MTKKPILSLLAMEKLLKRNGAHRVSADAQEALQEVLEEYADVLCAKAIALSEHAGRRTVQDVDVRFAAKG